MKLKLVLVDGKKLLYSSNGRIMHYSEREARMLLREFKTPSRFKGEDGNWKNQYSTLEEVKGKLLAYVDNSNKLVVVDPFAFDDIEETKTYISAAEYALAHSRSVAIIKRLCAEGRITGAYKTSSGWLIPDDAEYPKRKKRTI